jgi:hypothetical protein
MWNADETRVGGAKRQVPQEVIMSKQIQPVTVITAKIVTIGD